MSSSHLDANSFFEVNQVIQKSWDSNVVVRAMELEQGKDYCYTQIIKPWITQKVLSHTDERSSIMDIGCGCGYLTNHIYKSGRPQIIGVDFSPLSIQYAKKKYPGIDFICEDFCNSQFQQTTDLCLAVMVLNNLQDIEGFFNTAHRLLNYDGELFTILPHPCFWPQNHLSCSDYSYWNETAYSYSFATKGCSTYSSDILYFHRTLETYLTKAANVGFQLTEIHEFYENTAYKAPDILYLAFSLREM